MVLIAIMSLSGYGGTKSRIEFIICAVKFKLGYQFHAYRQNCRTTLYVQTYKREMINYIFAGKTVD